MDFKAVCVNDFEAHAESLFSKVIYDIFKGGANDEVTLRDNTTSFKAWKIRPRVLRDVTQRNLSCRILGYTLSFPVCIAPTGLHGLAHPEAETATAKGVQAAGVGFTMSLYSTKTLEEVGESAPALLRFLQLHIMSDKNLTLQIVRNAEKHEYNALVVSVDYPVLGKRLAGIRSGFFANELPYIRRGNFETLLQSKKQHDLNDSTPPKDVTEYFNPGCTWDDLKWLISVTQLPVIVKGILSGEDAKLAVECGVSGIIVSNHGGRQLDTVISAIDALPEVVAAVSWRCEVYMDGGVRNGTDIFKALALGAKAVFIGRPAVFALACDGAKGVAKMLEILRDEFSTTMALAGCKSVEDIKRSMVVQESVYKSKL